MTPETILAAPAMAQDAPSAATAALDLLAAKITVTAGACAS
jgi:hypothetical protein